MWHASHHSPGLRTLGILQVRANRSQRCQAAQRTGCAWVQQDHRGTSLGTSGLDWPLSPPNCIPVRCPLEEKKGEKLRFWNIAGKGNERAGHEGRGWVWGGYICFLI